MSRYLIQTRDFDNAKQKVFDNVKQYAEVDLNLIQQNYSKKSRSNWQFDLQ